MSREHLFSNLIDMLEKATLERENSLLFRQLHFENQPSQLKPSTVEEMSYRDFLTNVKSLSALIQTQTKPGERALLIIEPGIEYITSFFASLFAGVIVVPVYPPKNKDEFIKLSKIIADAKPSLFLMSKLIYQNFEEHGINKFFTKINSSQELVNQDMQNVLLTCLECYEGFNLLVSDAVKLSDMKLYLYWKQPSVSADSIAFLQYTSGSTSDPKGVILTHANLLSNLQVMYHANGYTCACDRHVVSWLPPYHDMGLIAGLLEIIYSKCSVTIFSPFSFIENPLRWLCAISDYKAGLTGSPNFGYDLCVKYFLSNDMAQFKSTDIDLSCMEVFACGAEPIRVETMENFISIFSEFGLRKEAMFPCYGLAESTLFVSGVKFMSSFSYETIDKTQFIIKNGQVEQTIVKQKFVSCGSTMEENVTIKIVDPELLTEMENGKVGEIWISSPSVAKGYWEKPELSEQVFHARINGDSDREYLRSGDLGFMMNGQLFVSGRRKDVIILNGVNYYPQDIEVLCSNCHSQVRTGCVVAFSHEFDGKERLVVIAETKASEGQVFESIIECIRKVIAEQIGISVYNALTTIVLMTKGGVLKTTSGKLRRQPTKQSFLNNKLPGKQIVHRWDQENSEFDVSQQLPTTATQVGLAKIWKELTGVEPNLSNNFFLSGGNSMSLIQLRSRIQQMFNVNISLNDLLNNPTLQQMSKLVERSSSSPLQILLKRRESIDRLDLSNSQKRFWFLHHLIDCPSIHNVFSGIRLKGDLDKVALEKSIVKIIERHESLRTSFPENNNSPIQSINPNVQFKLHHIDLIPFTDMREKISQLKNKLYKDVNTPFDLNQAPLLRANLYQLEELDHILTITFHHIIIDGWSMNLLVNELVECYLSYKNNQTPLLPQVLQYSDYTIWQQSILYDKQLHYWEEKLNNLPQPIKLPTQNSISKSFAGAHYYFSISPEHVIVLRSIISSKGATLYMGMLTIFNILLYRYSEQSDIAIGTPVVNRQQHVELESLIGLLVNTLVMRSNLNPNQSFVENLLETKSTVIEAFENQDVPFQKVVERLKDSRQSVENPLFQVMLAMHNPQKKISIDNLETEIVKVDNGSSMFNLTLELQEVDDGSLECTLEYRLDLFDQETIERLANNFIELIKSVIREPESKSISELKFLSESELDSLKSFGGMDKNDLSSPISNRTFHDLFEEQAKKTPKNTAVIFQGKSYSYSTLSQRSDQMAMTLRRMNHSENPFIAISVERSFELIVSLLAILKAGFAYLPLDPSYPEERLTFMLEDSQAGLLITQSNYCEKFNNYKGEILRIDKFDWSTSSTSTSMIYSTKNNVSVSPNDLAYLIYTSGSTGKPKGAMLTHKNVTNTLSALIDLYTMKESDKFIHYSSYSFDVSLEEIFLPLMCGASIVVTNAEVQYNMDELVETVKETKATIIGVTPSLWHGIRYHVRNNPKSTESLRIVTIGNESVDLNSVHEIQKMCPNASVINVCGGTETCIDSSLFKVPKDYTNSQLIVPIGKPIPGVKLYVLDSNRRMVPIGMPGEVYVGGNGVGKGYWKNETLTSTSFVENPFQTEEEKRMQVNGKLFKTGDLVKWQTDGNMVFISRLDSQIKLRGFRVELGEIQNVMRKSGLVREAIVILQEDAHGDSSKKQLVGYVVCHENVTQEVSDIIEQLTQYLGLYLPSYMVPAHIMCIDKIPITTNGKLDIKSLPKAIGHAQQMKPRNSEQNLSENQLKLREIWAKVLNLNSTQIGESDNFFSVGGNSILLAQLRSMIQTEMKVQIELKTFFEKTTIQSMVSYIETIQ